MESVACDLGAWRSNSVGAWRDDLPADFSDVPIALTGESVLARLLVLVSAKRTPGFAMHTPADKRCHPCGVVLRSVDNL